MSRMRNLLIGAVVAASLTAPCARAQEFRLTSPDLAEGGRFKVEQLNAPGCNGANVSPALAWSGAPAGTRSFAVTLFDPDAEVGKGWWHWIIYDIPPTVTALPKNAGNPEQGLAPAGSVQAESDAGAPGYGGPCPPKGDDEHRYVFKVYALDTSKLPAPPGSPAIPLHLHFHSLAQATLTGTYSRPGRALTP
jgi:Raf kinase inhibitor-like YbhB/YbcL family protein